MELLKFPSLASTSTLAMQLTKNSEHPLPFAVWALEQTKGRGRHGHSWLSPRGGLYLSLGLPTVGLEPLRAAGIVAEVLDECLHVRVSIKWPNDLLVNGKKVGGILCEGSLQGSDWGPTIVGIGLNIQALDGASSSAFDYQPTSLAAASLFPVDLESLVKALTEAFAGRWNSRDEGAVRRVFEKYGLATGHLFSTEAGSWLRSHGISPSGGATFIPASGPAVVSEVHSISKAPRWNGQAPGTLPQLVCDVGNTAIKCAVFADERLVGVERCLEGELHNGFFERLWTLAGSALPAGKLPRGLPIFVASVDPVAEREFSQRALEQSFFPVLMGKQPRRIWGAHYNRNELGLDRLAAMEGLAGRLLGRPRSGTANHLIVSAGTALTFDVMSGQGEHFGGLICPGLGTSLDSLANVTGLLPRLSVDDWLPLGAFTGRLPGNTNEAMFGGLTATLQGLLISINSMCNSAVPGGAPQEIWVTGGHGKAVREMLGGELIPALTLEGLRILAFG